MGKWGDEFVGAIQKVDSTTLSECENSPVGVVFLGGCR